MNRLIAIKLLWQLLCYLYYPSISIWWFRLWIISNTLDPPSKGFVIQCSVSYTRYILPMHQIHTFLNSRLGSSQPSPHASNCIRTKPSRRIPVKLGCHWPTCLWPLSSNHYPGYPMRKLTSYHKERRSIASNRFLNPTTNRSAQRW